MGLITDTEIQARITTDDLITGITPHQQGQVYHGPTPCGYNATFSGETLAITTNSILSDIKAVTTKFFGRGSSKKRFTIGGGDTLIAQTTESFKIPNDLIVFSQPLSTYMNVGLTTSLYPMVPGHVGPAKIQITNPTKNRVALYPGEGIIALYFVQITPQEGQSAHAFPQWILDNGALSVSPPQ